MQGRILLRLYITNCREVVVPETVPNRIDVVTRNSTRHHDPANPKVVCVSRNRCDDEPRHRIAAQKNARAGMKRSLRPACVIVRSEVGREKSARENVSVVVNQADMIVSVLECVLANGFDFLRVACVVIETGQEDFVREGFAKNVETGVGTSLGVLTECVAEKEFVIDREVLMDLREKLGFEPCLTLGRDSVRGECMAKATLIAPVLCLVVDVVVQPMTRLDSDE
jgi:hypothetical protein